MAMRLAGRFLSTNRVTMVMGFKYNIRVSNIFLEYLANLVKFELNRKFSLKNENKNKLAIRIF